MKEIGCIGFCAIVVGLFIMALHWYGSGWDMGRETVHQGYRFGLMVIAGGGCLVLFEALGRKKR